MKKQFFYLLFFLSFSLIFSAFSQNTESITISTYYPAPYGVYQTLRLYPSDTQPPCVSADTDSGTMYYDSGSGELMFCGRDINGNLSWQSSTSLWIRSGNSVYLRNNAWRVGIGTDNVVGMLVMYEHETQGAIHLAGKGDSGTYSGIYLDDDDENFTNRNTWVISHKKDTGADSENDLHITRWALNPATNTITGRLDLAIDSATGNLGVGTYNPQAKLEVGGGVKVGVTGNCRDIRAGCTANTQGTLRYCSGVMQYCNGSQWSAIGQLEWVTVEHCTSVGSRGEPPSAYCWQTDNLSPTAYCQKKRI
jgi:hypothetical protein